jgi:fatty acid desaturase
MSFRHLQYTTLNILLVFNAVALMLGGWWLWAGFLAALILSTVVDEAAGEERTVESGPQLFLDSLLYLSLPLLLLNVLAFSIVIGANPTGIWGTILASLGFNLAAAQAASTWPMIIGAILGLGLYIGSAGTNVAHELVHRTHSRVALLTGRWLLAFSFDTTFSIEHVHGHHRHIATSADPATAQRGENALAFFVRSTVMGNISAARIEAERLRRKSLPIWSHHNRVITGQVMSLALVVLCYLAGGWLAVAAFVAAGIHGKLYLELVNYIEHYGLVREPGARVEARHSWNTYKMVSSAMLYNLPRHSHHHMFAAKPFWTLEAEQDGPEYPHGYMTMILISLVPPLWRSKVHPLLEEWDRNHANEAERAILAKAGTLASGIVATPAK